MPEQPRMRLGPIMDKALDDMADQIRIDLRKRAPLIRPDVESALHRSFTARGPFADIVDATLEKWRAEEAARPWHAKVIRRIRAFRVEWFYRITKAWDHLRGVDCECDD